MSEQFSFDEINTWSWNRSVSLKSYKNPNFTMSDVSNQQLNQQPQFIDHNDQLWNLQEFNRRNEKKLKNRTNVKHFRQRKKKEQQKIIDRLKSLQAENHALRSEKYCKHCKKPFDGLIKLNETQKEKEKQENLDNENKELIGEEKQYFEFQKPQFYSKNQKKQNQNGKIWIALGMLMLVLGIHLYGFNGKEYYHQISISKIQSKKIIQIYQNKQKHLDDYFPVNVKYKEQDHPKQPEKKQNPFKKIKVFYQHENHSKSYISNELQQKIQLLEFMEEESESKPNPHKHQHRAEQQTTNEVKFHKDFLYAIQAEIDDLGRYI